MLELFLQKKSRQTWKMFLQADWKALQASTPDDISTQKFMSKRPRMFLRSSSMILCPVVSFSVAILGWPETVKVDTYPSMEVIYGTGTTRDTQIVRSFCQLIKRLTLVSI